MARKPKKSSVRSAEEVARRCLILMAVDASSHNERRSKLVPWLKREGLWKFVTPRESAFLRKRRLAPLDRPWATWRVEAVIPMLWALKRLPKLPAATQHGRGLGRFMPMPLEATGEFIASAALRSERAIRREQDLIYRTNWAVRDAQDGGKKIPRSVDPGVIQERHEALNWLMNDDGEDWDEVSTDT